MIFRFALAATICGSLAAAAFGQVTPAAGSTPPNDTPSFKVGTVIFADYTYQQSPTATDADGNSVHNSSFNVSRAYINVTGNLNHLVAYRVTPDITRESGSGSSLAGSYTFRLKYAFGQFNLDDWTTKGSWVRLGVQQTPFIDYNESIYRYRFQGTTFEDREGLFPSSDAGLSTHWNFPGGYGDLHAGVYNGEGYTKTETNNEKAFQIRGSFRPMPLGGVWKGLRLTGYIDEDHYVESAKRQRAVGQVTFEHPRFNAGADYVTTKDKTGAAKPAVDGKGYTIWATPKLGTTGWEALLRHDEFTPNKSVSSQKRKRDIAGIAYWFQHMQGVQTALMADYDRLNQSGFGKPNDTRFGLKLLINY
jgi:phosphate-selective porin O/P